jgi:hypothetical protein
VAGNSLRKHAHLHFKFVRGSSSSSGTVRGDTELAAIDDWSTIRGFCGSLGLCSVGLKSIRKGKPEETPLIPD